MDIIRIKATANSAIQNAIFALILPLIVPNAKRAIIGRI